MHRLPPHVPGGGRVAEPDLRRGGGRHRSLFDEPPAVAKKSLSRAARRSPMPYEIKSRIGDKKIAEILRDILDIEVDERLAGEFIDEIKHILDDHVSDAIVKGITSFVESIELPIEGWNGYPALRRIADLVDEEEMEQCNACGKRVTSGQLHGTRNGNQCRKCYEGYVEEATGPPSWE